MHDHDYMDRIMVHRVISTPYMHVLILPSTSYENTLREMIAKESFSLMVAKTMMPLKYLAAVIYC